MRHLEKQELPGKLKLHIAKVEEQRPPKVKCAPPRGSGSWQSCEDTANGGNQNSFGFQCWRNSEPPFFLL
jgi:hypothetical protein